MNNGKGIKKTVKILVWTIFVIIAIPTFAWLVLQSSQVQTILVGKISKFLYENTGIEVSIEKVNFRPFTGVKLNNVFISDLNSDTLIQAQSVTVSLDALYPSKGDFNLKYAEINHATVNFITDTNGVMNLSALLQKISKNDTAKSDSGNFRLAIQNIDLVDSKFRLAQANATPKLNGVNYQDFYFKHLNLSAENFCISGDTISAIINNIQFIDHSGFNLQRFRANFSLCSNHMHFDKLRISAHGSDLRFNKLHFNFKNWRAFSSFTDSVHLVADFSPTLLKTKALSYFVPEFGNYNITASLNGKVYGTISNIRGKNFNINFGSESEINTNFSITGLPNIDKTFLDVKIKELSTNRSDIETFTLTNNGKPLIPLPENFDELRVITYKGNFTGYLNNFVTNGSIASAIGHAKLDIEILPAKKQNINISGKLSTSELNIGKLIRNEHIGKVSLAAKIKGSVDKESKINIKTDAVIFSAIANGYNYKNIYISGDLTSKTYVGSIRLEDPNCKVNFLGQVDFSDTIPKFDFSAFVPKIDLVALNLNPKDSISQASFLLTTKFSGSNLDNSKGEIQLLNGLYRNQRGEFKLNNLTISADNSEDSRVITLNSDYAEGEIRSRYNFSKFPGYLMQIISEYIPKLNGNEHKEIKDSTTNGNEYLVKFRLKKTERLTSILIPQFKIAEHSSIFGILNPKQKSLDFKIRIPEVQYGSTWIKDLIIDGQTSDSTLTAVLTSPTIKQGNAYIRNFKVNSILKSNLLNINFDWNNPDKPKTYGNIEGNVDFSNYNTAGHIAKLTFNPSEFVINDASWKFASSVIVLDSSSVQIDNFKIYNSNQLFQINGKLSANATDSATINLKNFDISYLNLYLQNFGYNLNGTVNGLATVKQAYQNPNLFAELSINSLKINSNLTGNISLSSKWINSEKRMAVKVENVLNDTTTFKAFGDIFPETGDLNILADLNRIRLQLLSPLLAGNVSDIGGNISGKLMLTGTTDKPNLNGTVKFNNGELTIDFLKTHYKLNSSVAIENSNILFKDFNLTDRFKRIALLNGIIKTSYFNNFNLNLNLNADNFLCMNTTEFDNETFYGTVFGSGIIYITGKPTDINIGVNLKTENKTAIYLPLPTGSNVEQNNFVTFVNPDPNQIFIEETLPVEETNPTNLNVALNLQVTPEAEAQIIIDKKLGDIIKARGSGNLRMEINPGKDIFNMYGTYNIEKGDYLFTLEGVINKKFRIESGGYITWNGDPLDAIMDINAVYRVKTSLKQLLMNENYTTKVPVDCKIMLSQKLMSPVIKFDIDVPNADSQTKALVDGALNSEEKVNTQFLSLLIINSFIVDPNQDPNYGTMGLYNTASEMLSNQLSNWLSQWSNNFDIGINYRPGMEQDISSDQMELALSTQVLNDRVSINGNVDVGKNNSANPIAGDFNVDVKLNRSGKLRLKAFARSNDDILSTTEQNNYTTGAGIVYREDFNNLKDLLRRLKNTFKSDYQIEPIVPYDENANDSTNHSTDTTKNDSTFLKIE